MVPRALYKYYNAVFLQTYINPVHDITIIQVTTQLYKAINSTSPFRNVHIQLMKENVT